MTKCHFGLYGGSGTLQKFDALCVLGMNIINEKVITIFNTQLHIIVISINNIIASIQSFQIYKRKRQNEKKRLGSIQVYVVLWFWFMLLAVITGVSIVFRFELCATLCNFGEIPSCSGLSQCACPLCGSGAPTT